VVLNRNRDLYEYVVFRLGLDVQRQLLYAEVNASRDLINPRKLEVDAGSADREKLAKPLDDDGFGRSHLKEATEDRAQQKYA
jgi:hypothetical protein